MGLTSRFELQLMKKMYGVTVFLLMCTQVLFLTPALAQGKYYEKIKISVKYLDPKPKSRGILILATDSSLHLQVQVVNPAYRADPGGKHKVYLLDTISISASEIESLRVGPKSKLRAMSRTVLTFTGIGLVSGFVVGSQSDFGVYGGILVGIVFSSMGMVAGIPVSFITHDFTKKKYIINGNSDQYRAIVPKLQAYY